MKAKDIIKSLDEFAPAFLKDDWDNTGFQLGDDEKEINKILISLDLDNDILDYAIEKDIDMIINHHPIIFEPLKNITNLTPKGKLLQKLIKNDILVYNAHTNLDKTKNGVNDVLTDIFDLNNIEILFNTEEGYGHGRVGDIDSIKLTDFIEIVKEKLDIKDIIVFGEVDRIIKRVALCGGSGGDFINEVFDKNADIYLTGDVKYHEAQDGVALGLTILDAGHYHTEKVILPVLKDYLNKKYSDLEIELYIESSPKYKIY